MTFSIISRLFLILKITGLDIQNKHSPLEGARKTNFVKKGGLDL
jgi:hypothetical protein